MLAAIGKIPADQATAKTNAKTDKAASISCFTGDGSKSGTLREIYASPVTTDEFPTYKVSKNGDKFCVTGTVAAGKTTYNIGCDSTADNTQKSGWK